MYNVYSSIWTELNMLYFYLNPLVFGSRKCLSYLVIEHLAIYEDLVSDRKWQIKFFDQSWGQKLVQNLL